jgi:hypothetical protein
MYIDLFPTSNEVWVTDGIFCNGVFPWVIGSQDKDCIAESGVNHQKSINQSTIPLLRADSQH